MARAATKQPEVGAPSDGTRSLKTTKRIRPTWRAIVSYLLGGMAVVFAYSLGRREYLVIGFLAILLPVAGLIYVRLRRPKFEVTRLFSPPVVAVGGVTQVRVRITNLGGSASTGLVWDDALPWYEKFDTRDLPPIGTRRRTPYVTTYDLHPPRRGIYPVGPFVVEHEDPFGFATSTLAIGKPERLIVVPAVSSLAEGGPNLTDGEGNAHLVQRRVTGNDDDLTTREYRPGDALRRVHWRASARHGELMVRQEEHRSHPDARILVDTRLGGYPDAVRDPGFSWSADWASEGFEWVVRMTASLGLHLETAGFRVAIDETARPQIDAIGDRWAGQRAEGFLTSLAGVQLLERTLDRRVSAAPEKGTGPVFAVVGDPEDETVEWLVKHRRSGDAGYAFLVHARPGVLERLQDAGWVCVVAESLDDPADAWLAASDQSGYVRGSR